MLFYVDLLICKRSASPYIDNTQEDLKKQPIGISRKLRSIKIVVSDWDFSQASIN